MSEIKFKIALSTLLGRFDFKTMRGPFDCKYRMALSLWIDGGHDVRRACSERAARLANRNLSIWSPRPPMRTETTGRRLKNPNYVEYIKFRPIAPKLLRKAQEVYATIARQAHFRPFRAHPSALQRGLNSRAAYFLAFPAQKSPVWQISGISQQDHREAHGIFDWTMSNDAYYRMALAQMQNEHSQTVAALEQKVAALSQDNERLTAELRASRQQQQTAADQIGLQAVAMADAIVAKRYSAMTREVAALEHRLQEERDDRTKSDQAKSDRDWARFTKQLEEAKKRVQTAVTSSKNSEQRLLAVVQKKQVMKMRYEMKLRGKRDHIKYLGEELVGLHMELVTVEMELEKRLREESSSPTAVSSWSTTETETRIRKREEEEVSDSDDIDAGNETKRRRVDSSHRAFENLRLVR